MKFDTEFYKSPAWRAARAERLKIDNYKCVYCGATEQLEVHHKVSPVKGGAKLAMYNLETTCKQRCHKKIHPHLYNNDGRIRPTRMPRSGR